LDALGKSAYHQDVPRMQYEIGYGYSYEDYPSVILVDTESYKYGGVTLESVTWEVNNVVRTTGESSKIDLSISDIAGNAFADFMKLRTMNTSYAIFIKPPKSDGSLADEYLKYIVDGESVSVEFSQSTGFSYSVSGTLLTTGSGNNLTNEHAFNITGSKLGEGHTFKDYIEKEFVPAWNKNNKSKISVKIEDASGLYSMRTPTQTKQKNSDASSLIEPFTISPEMSIKDAIIQLFNERFSKPEDKNKKDVKINVFVKKVNSSNSFQILIKFLDKEDWKSATPLVTICCGPDEQCGEGVYRGEIGNLNFNNFIDKFYTFTYESSDSKDATQVGNDVHTPVKQQTKKSITGENEAKIYDSESLSKKHVYAGKHELGIWKKLKSKYDQYKAIDFVIEISMPYSFGLSPTFIGGELPEMADGMYLFKETTGAMLNFYWYSDSSCQSFSKHMLSGLYRIEKVSHTIGNGDMGTRVFLSHLVIQ
jgi:hypothetical protein